MILLIKKTFDRNGAKFIEGNKIETTREYGKELIAEGLATEIQPLMMDKDSFNKLMENVHQQSMLKYNYEEE
jgi:hypothetical protein